MFGSGERLTAAIVAFGKDGKHEVKTTIREGALRVLYGNRASAVMQFLEVIRRSLEDWAGVNPDLSEWKPPLTGFAVGERRAARAHDISGLIDQGVMMTASMGVLRAVTSPEANATLAADVWAEEVRMEVVKHAAPLKASFNRKVSIGQDMSIRIGFFSAKYAAQFGVLRSDPTRVSRDVMLLKSRIVDLGQLQGDLFEYTENRELIIGHKALDIGPIKERIRLRQKIDLITREADTIGIRVRAVTTANQAAMILIEQAA